MFKTFAFVLFQIHVIRPVLNRIDMLVETTSTDVQGTLMSHHKKFCS